MTVHTLTSNGSHVISEKELTQFLQLNEAILAPRRVGVKGELDVTTSRRAMFGTDAEVGPYRGDTKVVGHLAVLAFSSLGSACTGAKRDATLQNLLP